MNSSSGGGDSSKNKRTEVLAVIATIVAILTLLYPIGKDYFTPVMFPDVSYNIDTNKVFNTEFDGVKLFTKRANIKGYVEVTGDLSTTVYMIWNSGSVGITGEKIKPGIETISTPANQRILGYKAITAGTEPDLYYTCIPGSLQASDTWFTITCENESKLKIEFKSFAANAEVKLRITHTGKRVDVYPVEGLFADVSILKNMKVKTEKETEALRTKVRAMGISAGLLFFIFVPTWLMLSLPTPETHLNDSDPQHETKRKRSVQAALVSVFGLIVIIISFIAPEFIKFPQPPF